MNDLLYRLHHCRGLAFVLDFRGAFSWEPALDFVIRSLEDSGHHSAYLDRDYVTSKHIAHAHDTVAAVTAVLHQSGDPYILLSHVHGQPAVELRHGGGITRDDCMDRIKKQILFEIEML